MRALLKLPFMLLPMELFLSSDGREIKREDLIAGVGSTGRSVAPQLHYEVLTEGVQVDPEDCRLREGSDSEVF